MDRLYDNDDCGSLYSETDQNNIEELRTLLSNWNQDFLMDYFVQQKVFVNVLKVIKRHHIERLLKSFTIGTEILFEHNLEEWRASIGIPLVDKISIPSQPPQSPLSSLPSSRSSSPLRVTPYKPIKNELDSHSNDSGILLLSNILNETPKGVKLTEFYNKFSNFKDEQRTSLINLIAQYFEDKGIPISLATSYRLEREIIDRFPTEKLEYYRSGKRGRIYYKHCNLKTSFKAAVGKHLEQKKKPKTKRPRKKL